MIEIVSKGQSCRDHRESTFFKLCWAVLATVFVTLLTPKCCWITCLCVIIDLQFQKFKCMIATCLSL